MTVISMIVATRRKVVLGSLLVSVKGFDSGNPQVGYRMRRAINPRHPEHDFARALPAALTHARVFAAWSSKGLLITSAILSRLRITARCIALDSRTMHDTLLPARS